MQEYFQVGVIVKAHGLKGEVNVFPTTDDPYRFKKLKKVIMDTGRDGKKELNIERVKIGSKFVIVKFKEYNDINEVERFRQKPLIVPREDAIPLEEGEYYLADLEGMTVIDEDGKELGTIKQVIQTGANDVYEMKRTDEEDAETVMIPGIKECVKNIDIENKVMTIHVMDGLFD
ncbi:MULTISPECIES: ribosome maturation factor RimM [unclassified Butyrivibrio]|jgi:16S rRNA processing protein RimM|uniref:ribosome maturation factor RimM n=1 Tax=unclassified Butyrivibrio TaxID=2639466 RepID=UPI00042A61DA|nr:MULTISPECIES: ribosome maturation factor RimM [unclassified Butyrivibrio]